MMDNEFRSKTCQLINVAMVVKWPRCLSIMNNLRSIKSSRLRLLAIAVEKSDFCYECAEQMGIQVFEDYRDLLAIDHLDLILELTGDDGIISDIIARKRDDVGVLDRQASILLFDVASEITLESPLTSTLMEASSDCVFVIDSEYRIINCNKSSLIPGGVEQRSILGRYCFEMLRKSSAPCEGVNCPAQETRKTGKLSRAVYEVVGPDQKTEIRQVTAYPILNLFGEVAQCVLSIREMNKTLTDKIEERTQALKKDLARVAQEDRLTSLGRLVASVCHEINNPITSIVTFTKLVQAMIQRSGLSSEEKANMDRYLELSFREGMRCGSIVKNLLTFARPESMEAKLVDLTEVVNTIILLTSHQLELANVRHEVNLPTPPYSSWHEADLPTPTFSAWGDYAQIQQCLLNLVFNAIDAMPEGGIMTISGGVEEDTDFIWLEVSDTGHGIEPHHLPRIFEPFYSTKLDGKGVGLGLSMVYGIIREHQGEVEVESEPGKGTTFRIKLPRHPVNGQKVSTKRAYTAMQQSDKQ